MKTLIREEETCCTTYILHVVSDAIEVRTPSGKLVSEHYDGEEGVLRTYPGGRIEEIKNHPVDHTTPVVEVPDPISLPSRVQDPVPPATEPKTESKRPRKAKKDEQDPSTG